MTERSSGPDIRRAARILRSRMAAVPEALLVLGSGLAGLTDRLEHRVEVAFSELPGFPPAGVEAHAGRYVGGRLADRFVLVQSGRRHIYEGQPEGAAAAPALLADALGARFLLLTNAAGGVNPRLEPGDLVLLTDHLNLMARNPLVGAMGEGRVLERGAAYDRTLERLALKAASRLRIPLERGVYAGVHGPSYETVAEVRMLRTLGADVVGMSTVPEVIAARRLGIRCLAVSVVTNMAGAPTRSRLDHADVVEIAKLAGSRVDRLLTAVVGALPQLVEAK